MALRPELEVGDLIAVRRINTVPCCYCESSGCCALVGRRPRTGLTIEHVLCEATGRAFTRFWIHD